MDRKVKSRPLGWTTVEESKRLLDVGLSPDTADMYYEEVCDLPKVIVGNYILHNQCMEDKDYKKLSNPVLSPAWSLAALLDNIPQVILDSIKQYDKKLWRCCAYFASDWHNSDWYDNPVDACYEMILKLKELNLL